MVQVGRFAVSAAFLLCFSVGCSERRSVAPLPAAPAADADTQQGGDAATPVTEATAPAVDAAGPADSEAE